MKVLLDLSTLGLGALHPEMRGGGFRADEHLAEELSTSGECELAFTANHSSVTFSGLLEYLREHPTLAHHPVIGAPQDRSRSVVQGMLAVGYRGARAIFPRGPLPRFVRAGRRLVDRAVHPQVADTAEGADIFHSTQFPLPPQPPGRSPQRFLTIYDLRYRLFPELYDAHSVAVAEASLQSVGENDWVITSSESSRRDLVSCGVAKAERIFVVPLAADRNLFYPCHEESELRRVRAKYAIGADSYILCVNSIDVRKNMHQAIRAFTRLLRERRTRGLQLVIAGGAGSGSALMEQALAEAGDVRQSIVRTGFVDDEDLAALYSGAAVFLYPSLYEGFGLPPLEAMHCGTAVVTSDSSSLPEVVGEAALMVGGDDVDALSAALERVVTDAALRQSLSERGLERAAQFSWQRTGAGVLAAYRAALARR